MEYEKQFKNPSEDINNKEKLTPGAESSDLKQESLEREPSPSFNEECLMSMKTGKSVCEVLREMGQEALDGGINKRQQEWDEASKTLSSLKSFDYLENASDEELEQAYLKYFESQSSNYYLGKVITDLNSIAFRNGYFNAYNNKPTEELDSELLKSIKIVDKMSEVAKKIKNAA